MIGRALVVAAILVLAAARADAATDREYARACLAAAEGALLVDDAGLAREWLWKVPRGERGLEWSLLRGETDHGRAVLDRFDAAITDVAVDSASGRLAVACADGGVRLHPRPSVAPRRLDLGAEAYAVAWSPDGRVLAASGSAGTIVLAEPPGLRVRGTIALPEGQRATDLAFADGGARLVASLTRGGVGVWDVRRPARPDTVAFLRGHVARPPVTAIAALPGGRVASGSWDQWTKVWDVAARAATHTFGPGYGTDAPYTRFDDLAASPAAGGRLYAASARGVHGWSLADSAAWLGEDHRGWVNAVAVRAADELVASGAADRTVRLWDGATGETRGLLRGHTGAVTAAAFVPSTGGLVTGSADSTLRAWDATGIASRTWRAHATGVWGLAWGGTSLATASTDDTVSIWDAGPGGAFRRRLALGRYAPGAASVALARGGAWGVVGTNGGAVERFDAATGAVLATYAGHTGPVPAIALAHGDTRVVTAGNDGTVRVFDTATGNLLSAHRPGAGRATCVAVDSASGRIAAGFVDGTVRIIDPDPGGGELARLVGPGTAVTALAFRPSGDAIVAATEGGGMRAWALSDGRVLATLAGHQGATYGLCFTARGSRLVSASYDRTVRLWDAVSWELMGTLRGFPSELYGVAVSPDGARLAVGRVDGRVRMYDLEPNLDLKEDVR